MSAAEQRLYARYVEAEREARRHKQALRHHRRRLRECRDEIGQMHALAQRLGLELIVEADQPPTNGEEETHGHRTQRTTARHQHQA